MDSCDSIRSKNDCGIILANQLMWLSVRYRQPCLINMSFYKHHSMDLISQQVTIGSTLCGVFFMQVCTKILCNFIYVIKNFSVISYYINKGISKLKSLKRRRRDLNPCAAINDLLVFEARPFNHLGIPPVIANYTSIQYFSGFVQQANHLISSI